MTLDEYQQQALATAIYPGQGGPLGLIYVALKGAGEAGEFAEHVGKAIRDDALLNDPGQLGKVLKGNTPLTEERRTKLIKEIGDELWYCAAKAQELGITLGEVAQINIDKLAGRAANGTLGGSGDDR